MIKHLKKNIFFFLLWLPSTLLFSAPLFQVSDVGAGIAIRTVVPNHQYPVAGIKIITPGFRIARVNNECTPAENGFCIFSVSNSMPKVISISGFSPGNISIVLCLNAIGQISCQTFTVKVSSPIPHYTIGGQVTGLNAELVLQNNKSDTLRVPAGASAFQFSIPVIRGGSYSVRILRNPTGQTCKVIHGSGTNVTGNVNNILVTCKTKNTTYAYIVNTPSTSSPFVSRCKVSKTGLTGCALEVNYPPGAAGISLNSTGTVAYLISGTNIVKCPIDANGMFTSGCSTVYNGSSTFDSPQDLLVRGETAFVSDNPVNGDPGTLWSCDLTGVGSCVKATPAVVAPQGMALSHDSSAVYVTDAVGKVFYCIINQATQTFSSCTTLITYPRGSLPTDITLNNSETFAYISLQGSQQLMSCPINPDHTLGTCSTIKFTIVPFSGPAGVAIDEDNTAIYVGSYGNLIARCPIIQTGSNAGSLGSCSNSGATNTEAPYYLRIGQFL